MYSLRPVAFRAPTQKTKTTFKIPCEQCMYFNQGTCLRFFSQNPVDSGLTFFSAEEARKDSSYCGPEAKYFKPKKN